MTQYIRIGNRVVSDDPELGIYVNPEFAGWGAGPLPFSRRYEYGFEIPRGWGHAWHDYYRFQRVCAPVPINVLYRLAYLAWGHLVYPFRGATWWEKREMELRRGR
jgi:hypothetical protein